MASPEPSLSAAHEPVPTLDDGESFDSDDGDDQPGGSGSGRTARPTRAARNGPRRFDATGPTAVATTRPDDALDEDRLDDVAAPASVVVIEPATELVPRDDEYDDADDLVEVIDDEELVFGEAPGARGRLKARKVRRVVRYVSPWSVLKVSLLFYACLWVILTIASVLLWRAAVSTGAIENVEKFLARAFGESQFTIDGREIFRASTLAGLILVFAGTGFTVMMSLLFNVICDITGGIRFTVLELETVKRVRKTRASE